MLYKPYEIISNIRMTINTSLEVGETKRAGIQNKSIRHIFLVKINIFVLFSSLSTLYTLKIQVILYNTMNILVERFLINAMFFLL